MAMNSQNINFCKYCKISIDRAAPCPSCKMPGDRAGGGYLSITRREREMIIGEIDGKQFTIWVTDIKGKQIRLGLAGEGFKFTRAEIFNDKKAEVGNGTF